MDPPSPLIADHATDSRRNNDTHINPENAWFTHRPADINTGISAATINNQYAALPFVMASSCPSVKAVTHDTAAKTVNGN
jgi:hypothetical protein